MREGIVSLCKQCTSLLRKGLRERTAVSHPAKTAVALLATTAAQLVLPLRHHRPFWRWSLRMLRPVVAVLPGVATAYRPGRQPGERWHTWRPRGRGRGGGGGNRLLMFFGHSCKSRGAKTTTKPKPIGQETDVQPLRWCDTRAAQREASRAWDRVKVWVSLTETPHGRASLTWGRAAPLASGPGSPPCTADSASNGSQPSSAQTPSPWVTLSPRQTP